MKAQAGASVVRRSSHASVCNNGPRRVVGGWLVGQALGTLFRPSSRWVQRSAPTEGAFAGGRLGVGGGLSRRA